MISGLNLIQQLQGYGAVALKINKILSEMGFKKIMYNAPLDLETNYYNELTLSVFPTLTSSQRSEIGEIFSEILSLKGCLSCNCYVKRLKGESKDDICYKDEKLGEVVVGRYYPDRNLVLFYYPIFHNTQMNLELKNNALFWLLEVVLESCMKRYGIKEKDIKKDIYDIVSVEFLAGIRKKIEDKEISIKNYDNYIKQYESEVMNNIRNRINAETEKSALIRFADNGKEMLIKELKEIESLKFVKSVKVENDGIRVNIGDVSIKVAGYKGKDGIEKEVPIGEIEFFITPNKIYVDNLKRKTVWYDGYDREIIHPHVLWGDCGQVCWGSDRQTIIYDLLARFKFKDLIYMLNLWAKSYTPNDKYIAIGYWTGELGIKPKKEEVGTARNELVATAERVTNYLNMNIPNIVHED
jgi:hypothetical protein